MYRHVQRSPLHLLLYLPAILSFFAAWQMRNDGPPSMVLAIVAVVCLLLSLSFQTLSVSGDEESLMVRYGPLNLFGTQIQYRDITSAEPATTSWIDGWGIHFIPFRGWTFNLWGFECVKLNVNDRVIRIGTDDSENLVDFLRDRIASN